MSKNLDMTSYTGSYSMFEFHYVIDPEILKELPVEAKDKIINELKDIKNLIAKAELCINNSLNLEFKDQAKAAYEAAKKDSGKVLVTTIEGPITAPRSIDVISNISKKVTWVQEKLRTLFGSMPMETAESYIDYEFSISERNYLKLKADLPELEKSLNLAGQLVPLLDEARVVEYGTAKISLERVSA